MTSWSLVAASSSSEWTLHSTLQLALPAVAIVVSTVIALIVSRRAYQGALRAQVAAAHLERERRAHDELLAVLGQFIEWFCAAIVTARSVSSDWELRHLPQLGPRPDAENQKENALATAKILEAGGSLQHAARWIRDSALFYPIRGDVLFYLDVLGPSVSKFWERVHSAVADPPTSEQDQELEIKHMKDAVRYMGFVSDFCQELRVLVHNSELRKYHANARLASEKWHWLNHEEGVWGFAKTPPYLPGLFVEDVIAEMDKEFAAEPLETWHFGESKSD